MLQVEEFKRSPNESKKVRFDNKTSWYTQQISQIPIQGTTYNLRIPYTSMEWINCLISVLLTLLRTSNNGIFFQKLLFEGETKQMKL